MYSATTNFIILIIKLLSPYSHHIVFTVHFNNICLGRKLTGLILAHSMSIDRPQPGDNIECRLCFWVRDRPCVYWRVCAVVLMKTWLDNLKWNMYEGWDHYHSQSLCLDIFGELLTFCIWIWHFHVTPLRAIRVIIIMHRQ